jgi:hypothetical protein
MRKPSLRVPFSTASSTRQSALPTDVSPGPQRSWILVPSISTTPSSTGPLARGREWSMTYILRYVSERRGEATPQLAVHNS